LGRTASRLNLELTNFTVRNADEVGRALGDIAAADSRRGQRARSPMPNGVRRPIFGRLRDARLPSIHEGLDGGCLIGKLDPNVLLRTPHGRDFPIELRAERC
jgi:hypothetical protein